MHSYEDPTSILVGPFGRATLHLTQRGVVAHAHAEYNLLFKIGGADAVFNASDRLLPLSDKSAIIFNPWESHSKLESSEGPTLLLSLLVDPQWMSEALKSPVPLSERLFVRQDAAMTAEIRALAERLVLAASGSAASDDDLQERTVVDLVTEMAGMYGSESFETLLAARKAPVDARIRRAMLYIREHVSENPGMDDVASRVGLSRSRFFEQFKRTVGVPPQHYLDWARMNLATRLLVASDISVADVSDSLGFSAPTHFARFFTQHVGIPPSDFRRRSKDITPHAKAS